MTIEIWNVAIAMYRTDEENEVDITSILDAIQFIDLADAVKPTVANSSN
jgi:hypothetical protein